MQKKQTILVVASLLVVVLSVTLAYFTAQIIGKGKSVTINSADLKIVFTDNDGSISGSNIEPGKWNVTKTFTIENKSNETYKYNIVIQDLVNTFVTEGYLQYKITSTNGGYNMEDYKDVPKSETATDTILAYSASIDVGVTQTYTVEFIYANDENVNQNVDQNKILSGKLFITAGTEKPTLANLVKANAVNENGYRYEGVDPNNYITMEKTDGTTEMWRIIGLFPEGENGENVIRVRKVGYEIAKYDSNETNHWPNTTLYAHLKDIYSIANYKNTVNYKMYLGTSSSYNTITVEEWYTAERGSTPGKTSSTSYNSTTTFIGSVGLMYPSDYAYGVLASNCVRTTSPYTYGHTNTRACRDNNWLYQGSSTSQWLISPGSTNAYGAFYVPDIGYVNLGYSPNSNSFSPVMALKSDVVVTGSGTKTEPYVMQ